MGYKCIGKGKLDSGSIQALKCIIILWFYTQWQENELVGSKETQLASFNEQMREILHEHVIQCTSLVLVIWFLSI